MNMKMATTRAHHGRNIWLQVAIVSILFIIDGAAVNGRANLVSRKMRLVKSLKKPKATIKTIQIEDGDIIDCVDIYKQPAFDHPLLVNHTIQMKPSDHVEELASARNASSPSSSIASSAQAAQLRQLNAGDCPEGTVPILRTKNNAMVKENATTRWDRDGVLYVRRGHVYGASGYLNVWDLKDVPADDRSSGYTLLATESPRRGVNIILAGWEVNKPIYGDQKTRFTTYWWAAGFQNTGCYNLDCPGFVQTNPRLYLGALFERTSTFGGFQAEFKVTIYMDRQSNNWWLKYFDTPMGYWPASLFDDFKVAEAINWGGEVALTSIYQPCPMGNGHYPSEGLSRVSAYISGALYRGYDNKEYEPDGGGFYINNKKCYEGISVGMGKFGRPGYSFYYGGNGQRQGCYLKNM